MAGSVSKEALLKIVGDSKSAEEALARIDVKYDELKLKIRDEKLVPQLDRAKVLAQAAVLREELKKELKVKVEPEVSDTGLLKKALSFLGGTGGSGLSGKLSGVPLAGGLLNSGGIYALAGVVVTAAALLPLVVGIVSGLAAATAGIGAFGLLALPTLDKIKNQYTALQTAQQGVVSAQKNYTDAVEKNKLDPTKANAAAVQTALLKLKVAQQDAANATTPATSAISRLVGEFHQMSTAFEPTAMKTFTQLLGVANTLMPDLKPFATAAGGAIDGLLGKVETFFKSADFKAWLGKFEPIVAPAITSIGTGVGKLATSFGQLLTVLPAADDIRAIGFAFDVINGALVTLTGTVKVIMGPLSALASLVSFLGGSGGSGGIGGPNVTSIPKSLAGFKYTGGKLPVLVPSGTAPSQVKTHFASGGLSSGGLAMVGESGPELMNLPGGTRVYSHAQTMRMLSAAASGGWSGGGGGAVNVTLRVAPTGNGGLDRLFMGWLRQSVYTTGGGGPKSVQIALGQTH